MSCDNVGYVPKNDIPFRVTWPLLAVLSVCDHIFAECDTNEEKVTCYSHQSGHMMMMQLLDFFFTQKKPGKSESSQLTLVRKKLNLARFFQLHHDLPPK